MPMSAVELDRKLAQLHASGRILEAHSMMEFELRASRGRGPSETSTDRACRLLQTFNLGVSWRSQLGNGIEARKLFNEVGGENTIESSSPLLPGLRELCWKSRENSMLLALSYDEYERWADGLRKLEPANEILSGQFPKFIEGRKHGRPWSEMLVAVAQSYYHDGEPNDPKQWSEAAATYQLMLENRKTLRLDRAAYGRATVRHGVLCLRLSTRACPKGAAIGSQECPEDPIALVSASLPYLEAYLRDNPADTEATKVLGWVHSQLESLAERRVSNTSKTLKTEASPKESANAGFFKRLFSRLFKSDQ